MNANTTTTNKEGTMPSIDQWLENARKADGKAMSDERLSQVFDLVKPEGNWKDPINAAVRKDAATKAEIETAVAWFAGGVPTIEEFPNGYVVKGEGYYAWVGA